MRAVSSLRYRPNPLIWPPGVILVALVVGVALLAGAVLMVATATAASPPAELLAPFRWLADQGLA